MIKPLSLFVGWRYTRAKKRRNFVSFIAFTSVFGVALGVTVLITVLSVMNGFDKEIRSRFFTIAPHVTVNFPAGNSYLDKWKSWASVIKANKQVKTVVPFAAGKGAIFSNATGQFDGLILEGVNPALQISSTDIQSKVVAGSFSGIEQSSIRNPGIVVGKSLADNLGLHVGSSITVAVPKQALGIDGRHFRTKNFTVKAIYSAAGVDSMVAYININFAKILYKGDEVNGLHIRLYDIYKANDVTHWLYAHIPYGSTVTNWTYPSKFGSLYQALGMEKTMMFIILLLLVAIAAFNLVSTLVMVVTDKRSDIAILKTLGARPRTIMFSFMFQGMILGFVGSVLGLLGGLLLASHISNITIWLQHAFHVQLVSKKLYGIDYLPSILQLHDVLMITLISFGMCVLATFYPAWLALRTQPAEALRYE
jgi:lipoprotein-releasing system permease protein